jgi:alkylation response protein AidB-like acyl-CoA dehydrogenase
VTGRGFSLHGEKSFVTNGGHADSYVVSAVKMGDEIDPGTFTCLLMDSNAPGLDLGPPWAGFGMRGNSSLRMSLNGTTIPPGNLLGSEGDQTWYVFEVVAPYFLVAMGTGARPTRIARSSPRRSRSPKLPSRRPQWRCACSAGGATRNTDALDGSCETLRLPTS